MCVCVCECVCLAGMWLARVCVCMCGNYARRLHIPLLPLLLRPSMAKQAQLALIEQFSKLSQLFAHFLDYYRIGALNVSVFFFCYTPFAAAAAVVATPLDSALACL